MQFTNSTEPNPRTAGIPMPVGWHTTSYNGATDVAIDVAIQAVARCHACGTTAPFGIGEPRGSAEKYVDGPCQDAVRAAWDWTDQHLKDCPQARPAAIASSTRPLAGTAGA
ncbi:hypothetical protein ACH4FX_06885 [Streptomyces sp. NPDC018019]|uniref:hypothetical protein n=1 Tax=Streptomyces sp. NPDC018019 TaxID=3365030 RepID=UPI0037B05F17